MKNDRILMAHGAGGKMSQALTERIFLKYFHDPALLMLNDNAVFDVPGGRVAMSTDTYTIDPIFFPGGDIGSLSVHGTVNDVAMCGAVPVAISAGFILEEGLPLEDLEIIAASMATAAATAGVRIVTADTKVVPRGAADRIFINTTGIGIIPEGRTIGGQMAKTDDVILLSGTIGDHGIAVASSREGIRFETVVRSDSAPLNSMVSALVGTLGDRVHVLRDPTRGGLATVLNEISAQSNVGIRINEGAIPVSEGVQGACELFGYDPLYLANEGKLVAIVSSVAAEDALRLMRSDPLGRETAIIGEVVGEHPGRVVMNTPLGGHRLVDRLSGEMLPRIC